MFCMYTGFKFEIVAFIPSLAFTFMFFGITKLKHNINPKTNFLIKIKTPHKSHLL